jgi:hypothetical protein
MIMIMSSANPISAGTLRETPYIPSNIDDWLPVISANIDDFADTIMKELEEIIKCASEPQYLSNQVQSTTLAAASCSRLNAVDYSHGRSLPETTVSSMPFTQNETSRVESCRKRYNDIRLCR